MQAVAQQPVAVSVHACQPLKEFQDESVLLADDTFARECNAVDSDGYPITDHVVTVVGYDVGSGVGKPDSFWIIKNSWGTAAHDKGFFKIRMYPDGTTGACNMYAYSPVHPLDVNLPSEPPSKANKPVTPGPKLSAQACKDKNADCKSWAKNGECTKR